MTDTPLENLPFTPAAPALPRPRLHRSGVWRERFELLTLIIVVFTLVNLATMRFFIEGPSMQPNFHDGQFLIVSRVHYLLGSPARGDIAVFDAPGDDNRANNPLLIKRVMGLPGDHMVIEEGATYINDQLIDEPFINHDGRPYRCSQYCDVILGADEYFMMGDNRNDSNDSRAFGPVTRNRIVGEAIIRYWPPSDWGSIVQLAYPG